MDGVLVDGEPLHFQAVNALLGEEGKSMSFETYQPYMGTKSGWSDMIRDLALTRAPEYYRTRYNDLILDQYNKCSVPMPGSVGLVRALKAAAMPIAVCSSSVLPWVDACLSRIGVLDAFDAIVTGSDVEHGKPAPDIYLLAAERLGVDPHACLAIEDAPAGVESARAAGMTVWVVRTDYTRDLDLPGAHRILESLEEVSIEDLIGVAA